MSTYGATARVLAARAREDKLQTLTRGAPHHPTTEMYLAIWSLATRMRDGRRGARCSSALRPNSPRRMALARSPLRCRRCSRPRPVRFPGDREDRPGGNAVVPEPTRWALLQNVRDHLVMISEIIRSV